MAANEFPVLEWVRSSAEGEPEAWRGTALGGRFLAVVEEEGKHAYAHWSLDGKHQGSGSAGSVQFMQEHCATGLSSCWKQLGREEQLRHEGAVAERERILKRFEALIEWLDWQAQATVKTAIEEIRKGQHHGE